MSRALSYKCEVVACGLFKLEKRKGAVFPGEVHTARGAPFLSTHGADQRNCPSGVPHAGLVGAPHSWRRELRASGGTALSREKEQTICRPSRGLSASLGKAVPKGQVLDSAISITFWK